MTTKNLTDMNINDKAIFLKSILSDLQQEIISRRDPEYLYTSAYIAACGAVAWGMATLRSVTNKNIFIMGVIATVWIWFLGYSVFKKIERENEQYEGLRDEQVKISKILLRECNIDPDWLPRALKESPGTEGHKFSQLIVGVSGIGAGIFCVLICFFNK